VAVGVGVGSPQLTSSTLASMITAVMINNSLFILFLLSSSF
jgi:hypothetical protein